MKRREFIALLGSATALGWVDALCAQPAAGMPRVGLLFLAPRAPLRTGTVAALLEGLLDLGYTEGQTFVFDERYADWKLDRLPVLARELVSVKVDVIVASPTPAAIAAKQATPTIPIVAPAMGNPVEDGLVDSLAAPGANVTGCTFI